MGIFNVFNKKSEDNVSLPFGSKEFGKFLDEQYKESIDEVIILADTLYEEILEYDNIVSSIRDLQDLKAKFLGKSGEVTSLMKLMKEIPNEEKANFGKLVNALPKAAKDAL